MGIESFKFQAELCRCQANLFDGRPENGLLLDLARSFDALAEEGLYEAPAQRQLDDFKANRAAKRTAPRFVTLADEQSFQSRTIGVDLRSRRKLSAMAFDVVATCADIAWRGTLWVAYVVARRLEPPKAR